MAIKKVCVRPCCAKAVKRAATKKRSRTPVGKRTATSKAAKGCCMKVCCKKAAIPLSGRRSFASTDEGCSLDYSKIVLILKVAYYIIAIDGKVLQSETKKFLKIASQMLSNHCDTRQIARLVKGFADDADGFAKIAKSQIVYKLLERVGDEVRELASNPKALRSAFAVWISICCADEDYSAIEREAISALRNISQSGSRADVVTDAFLEEVERRVMNIGLSERVQGEVQDKFRKANLRDVIDYEVYRIKILVNS